MNQSETKQPIDVYNIVTERIITLLESGIVPWRKPWSESGPPQNLISKRPYRGVNHFLLNSLDYPQNLFITWKQLKAINGSVNKGEKGSVIVFTHKEEKLKENGEIEKRFILRYYKVFAVEQCSGIPDTYLQQLQNRSNNPLVECSSVVDSMPNPPTIVFKKKGAFYSPLLDVINMPKLSCFESSEGYYGTLFHELIHSTGSVKRLNRREVAENPNFGTDMYAMEELVAEMGCCFLKSHTGTPMETLQNSAAYIKNWLVVLKDDKRFVIKAASQAQRAVDYILQTAIEVKENEDETVGLDVVS
jgi:antirestriction protein ArdC